MMRKVLLATAIATALFGGQAMAEELSASDINVTTEAVDFQGFDEILMGSEEEAIKYATGENQVSFCGTAKATVTFPETQDFLTIAQDTSADVNKIMPVQDGEINMLLNPTNKQSTGKNAKPKFAGTLDGAFMICDAQEAGLDLTIGEPEVVGSAEGREDMGLKSAKDYQIQITEKSRTPFFLVYEKSWGDDTELNFFYVNKKGTMECIVDDDRTIEEEFQPTGVVVFDDVVPTGCKVIEGTWEKIEDSDTYTRTDTIRFPKAMTALVAVTEEESQETEIYCLSDTNKLPITRESGSDSKTLSFKVTAIARSDRQLHEDIQYAETRTWEECFEQINGYTSQDAIKLLFSYYGITYDPDAAAKELDDVSPDTVYTDKEIVKQVQEALNKAGFDCGTPDGIAGAKTYAAMNAYQQAKGLKVTNDITRELLKSLGINPES